MSAHTIPNLHDVHTTVLFLAKYAIKDSIRRSGRTISHYKSSDIETAAKRLVASDPEFTNLANIINVFFSRKSGVKFP